MNEERDKTEAADVLEAQPEGQGPAWEAELDTYPLRDPSEDPRWAMNIVWIWFWFALFSLAFLLVLIVLGFYYE